VVVTVAIVVDGVGIAAAETVIAAVATSW